MGQKIKEHKESQRVLEEAAKALEYANHRVKHGKKRVNVALEKRADSGEQDWSPKLKRRAAKFVRKAENRQERFMVYLADAQKLHNEAVKKEAELRPLAAEEQKQEDEAAAAAKAAEEAKKAEAAK